MARQAQKPENYELPITNYGMGEENPQNTQKADDEPFDMLRTGTDRILSVAEGKGKLSMCIQLVVCVNLWKNPVVVLSIGNS